MTVTLVTTSCGLSSEVRRMFSKKFFVSSGEMSSRADAIVLSACSTDL